MCAFVCQMCANYELEDSTMKRGHEMLFSCYLCLSVFLLSVFVCFLAICVCLWLFAVLHTQRSMRLCHILTTQSVLPLVDSGGGSDMYIYIAVILIGC